MDIFNDQRIPSIFPLEQQSFNINSTTYNLQSFQQKKAKVSMFLLFLFTKDWMS